MISFWLLGKSIAFYNTKPANVAGKTIQVKKNVETTGNLTWYRLPADAYIEAKKSQKKIFIDFYADWCTNCKEFSKLAISDPLLNQALQSAVLLKVYDTDKAYDVFASDARFQELNVGLPFFLVLDSEKNMLFKTNDYLQTDKMVQFLKN